MKRGKFMMTTVTTGLLVAGLMAAGRAGLNSPGLLFLAGQLKIAAGDTESGMKLLSRAAAEPAASSNSMLLSEKPSPISSGPCKKSGAPVVKAKVETPRIKYAPEPTLARVATPEVPLVLASFVPDPAMFMSREQQNSLRAQQYEIQRAQQVREQQTRRMLREISLKDRIPSAERIRDMVQKGMDQRLQ